MKQVRAPTSFFISFGVSWGELTSSKLQAPSYEEAVKRAGATDYRPPTTYRLASTASSSGVSGVLATALSAATRIWRE